MTIRIRWPALVLTGLALAAASQVFAGAVGRRDRVVPAEHPAPAAVSGASPGQEILAGVRIPAVELPDGRIAVFGAFDAVQWTAEVADYELSLREALPPGAGRQLQVTGSVSPRARAALEERGWVVHPQA